MEIVDKKFFARVIWAIVWYVLYVDCGDSSEPQDRMTGVCGRERSIGREVDTVHC